MPDIAVIAVSSILHHDPERGGAIFAGEDAAGGRIKVIAPGSALSRIPQVGETWRVNGAFEHHATHGRQLKALRCDFVVPRGRLLVHYLTCSKSFPGIGETTATKLFDAFGESLNDILGKRDVEQLSTIVSESVAQKLVDAWGERQVEMELVEYLDQHGFGPRLTKKLVQCWGDSARAMLEANPYLMLAFAGWGVVDAGAMKLKVAVDDERRLVGAAEAALYGRLNSGHTRTQHQATVGLVARLIGRQHAEAAIAAALSEGAIIGSKAAGYQSLGAWSLEEGILARLQAMLAGEAPEQASLFLLARENDSDLISQAEETQGFRLNTEQAEAVHMAVERPISLLLGGAGVGKTTVLRVILSVLEARHWTSVQLALAGRAAQRMAEATGRPAMTIAKFLQQIRAGKLEVPAQSLVVIDEASMLDLPTLYRILRYLPDGVRLLLVGDPAQLPPIGFGLTFHLFAMGTLFPKTELTQVHRQAESTGIPAVASAIRAHTVPTLAVLPQDVGVSFIECPRCEIVSRLFELIADWNDDWRVIGSVKNGAAGVNDINLAFHHHFAAGKKRLVDFPYAVGDPVVYLRNDYDRGLMNGSLGTVVGFSDEQRALVARFDEDEHTFSFGELSDLELAYAITCHKAQGSQFKRVAIPITKNRILDHALVYTALTRGVEQVVFLGDKEAFDEAVTSSAKAGLREVGLELAS